MSRENVEMVRASFEAWNATGEPDFSIFHPELVYQLIDAGDRVIAATVAHARVSASSADVNDAYVFVYKLRDGLIVEGWEYRTRQEALEAVGPSE